MIEDLIRKINKSGLFQVSLSEDKNEWISLKNGNKTPIFLDTSKFISKPNLLEEVSRNIINLIEKKNISFDKMAGIPYGGLPFVYNISSITKTPCLAIRKEGFKNYSTKGEVLGEIIKGDKILLIEDATVTANTALEMVEKFRKKGLLVTNIITILDIEKGAKENLEKIDVNLHALLTWKSLFKDYKELYPELKQNKYKYLEEIINN